jgi:hypothetical protein
MSSNAHGQTEPNVHAKSRQYGFSVEDIHNQAGFDDAGRGRRIRKKAEAAFKSFGDSPGWPSLVQPKKQSDLILAQAGCAAVNQR